MNTARLKAFVTGHKTPLMVAGAVLVVAAALYARKRSALAGADTGTTSSSTSGATSAGTYSAYGSTASGTAYTPYDSTASDIYNALQPQIEQLQEIARNIPVNTSTEAGPDVQGYFRRTGTQAVYQALSDGTLRWVDAADYAAAGKPTFTDLAKTDPLWNRTVVGTDAPAQFR